MKEKLRLGLLGFGEVGYYYAREFRKAGVDDVVAYNNGSTHRPPYTREYMKQAEDIGVTLVGTIRELAQGADIVLSVVTPKGALPAALAAAPFLRAPVIYADLNSCSPRDKKAAAAAINASGGRYVDAALMGFPLNEGLKALILASGAAAEEFQEKLGKYGTNVELVDGEVGTPAAMKLLSAILIKGTQSLVFQAVYASHKAGIDPDFLLQGMERHIGRALASPKGPRALADNVMGRVGIHAERRIPEMQAVAEMVKDLGIDPILEEALWKHTAWVSGFATKDYFGGKMPPNYQSVLEAMDKAPRPARKA
jgi:3-hydroxyisobutyrate dehydrogenase-like beta-hydroxyacid dehydrogenase